MAKIIELHAPTTPTGKATYDPAAASRIAQCNGQRRTESIAAKQMTAGSRATLNRLNIGIGDAKDRYLGLEAEFKEKCSGRTHRPSTAAWISVLIFVAGFIAEFAIADGLLDFAFLKGRADDAITFLEHFEGRGIFEGILFAITDYSTQKEWAAIGIATYTFASAKYTGTWIRQRQAERSSMPAWLVVAFNAVFLAACVGYVFLRYASLDSNPDSADLAYLAPVFLPIQLFFYAGATFVAAALADPDPEAARLGSLLKAEKKALEKLVLERSKVSAEVTSILVGAQAKCDQLASQALWDIAAYRHANLLYRDPTETPPAFLTAAISPGVFEPIAFDPPPECPAHTLEEILKPTGTG